jgi:hypothetical protein
VNSNKKLGMADRTSTRAMQVSSFAALIVIFSSMGSLVFAEQTTAPWRQFDMMGKVVTVEPELGEKGVRSYEVLAAENGLATARLSVNRNGVLSDTWKTDLDSDGNPEIVVIVGQLGGGNAGSADIHEWDGHKFASVRAMQKIDSEGAAYDGHDQYKIVNGNLLREFPRFRSNEGRKVPSGGRASFRYDMKSGQWISL